MRRFRKTIRDPSTLTKGRAVRMHFDVKMDLHGYTAEEAVSELEEELFASESESILIVHGKGNGILRQRIRAFLTQCDDLTVEYGETANIPGGDGVTAVYT
jgi:DNA-nicking Smr family endonuclease